MSELWSSICRKSPMDKSIRTYLINSKGKGNKRWVWLAIEVQTCEIIGMLNLSSLCGCSSKALGVMAIGFSYIVWFAIQIYGLLMQQSSLANGIKL
ncbi:hypothetical protein VV11_012350 [Trichodesmium erythraeum 21-75]|nr:hypothetical protein [Trichodesmium erythraeum 21-75]